MNGHKISGEKDIIKTIESFFDIGKTKDLAPLRDIQLDDPRFSSFSDVPPHDLKDYKTTIILEELRFIGISDYNYKITNPKISIFEDTAVAAFEIMQSGMLVDTKTYTGEHMVIHSRASFVLVKQGIWKIVHIHLSQTNK